jgi:hypothetical protein
MLSTASPKPARGTARAERDEKRRQIKAHEVREKAACRARDGDRCRWPGCGEKTRIESAHLADKGMGGDHGRRTRRDLLVRLCEGHHRGPCSLHSGDLRIECLTEANADGALLFMRRDEQRGWLVMGCEDGR